ncbi:divergent PAP2 family protein [Thermanaerothrix sp.]|jgi:acid phosphatase family membrane protein YuiD|uniref:divergent PAP2 family protein n=1 Tax=Thermanaerothrix sp. TaxID=2972675 RepID=UPI002ADD6E34|nr:divergent PAP2 family protein [Thermanaerothrix sp.]
MVWEQLLANRPLLAGLLALWLAQFLKVPIDYWVNRRWNWNMWFSMGGMPSSHAALMVATTLAVGLYYGFDHPVFALGMAITMVVLYDAAGVRRQAGVHAQKLNVLLQELFSGQPISQERLKEMLGHTPRQVAVGSVLGALIALGMWWLWR